MPHARCARAVLIVTLGALSFTGCQSLGLFRNRPSAADATARLTGFDVIDVAGLVVDVTVGSDFAVAAEGAQARVEKDTLVLAPPRAGTAPARVRVALPKLRRLIASGGRVVVAGESGPRLELAARDASVVSVSAREGTRLFVEATGQSRIILDGAAEALHCSLAEGSRGDARQLKVRVARVSLAGASRLDLQPLQAVSGQASGASLLAMWNRPPRVKVGTRDSASVSYVR